MTANNSPLARHFEDLDQQQQAATLGMWVFLATELMVFGGLFTGYVVYRALYPLAFEAGSRSLSLWFGGVNTVLLLSSSLAMAMAVHAAQLGRRRAVAGFLVVTAALGAAFLVIKGFEYCHDYQEQLVPGLAFDRAQWPTPPGAPGTLEPVSRLPETTAGFADQVRLFLVFYYVMTGVHALHLIIGIGIMLVLTVLAWRGRFSAEYYIPVDIGGLYWHFVDVVWIFLLPLLYLVGTRH